MTQFAISLDDWSTSAIAHDDAASGDVRAGKQQSTRLHVSQWL
jgi:hypothetical protein